MLQDILLVVIGLVIGAVIGFFVKIMMSQMGRTPTQKQINQMMKAMNNAK